MKYLWGMIKLTMLMLIQCQEIEVYGHMADFTGYQRLENEYEQRMKKRTETIQSGHNLQEVCKN